MHPRSESHVDSPDRFDPGEPDRAGPESGPDDGDGAAGDGPFPWDEPAAVGGDDPDSPRERHDAFTEARKCAFLQALVKTGGILDACRLTGVSARTVYRAELEASSRPHSLDEVRDSILTKLEAIERHRTPERLAAGWTRTPDGDWIPPGYGPLPGGPAAPEGEGPGPETPRDSL